MLNFQFSTSLILSVSRQLSKSFPFTCSLLIPLKTSESQMFSDVFRWDQNRTLKRSDHYSDEDNLEVTGYNLMRVDHSANKVLGGVYIYYRNDVPLEVLDIQFLNESINLEMKTKEMVSFPLPKKII